MGDGGSQSALNIVNDDGRGSAPSEASDASDALVSSNSEDSDNGRHNEMLEGVFGSDYGARERVRVLRGQALERGATVDLTRPDDSVSKEQLLAPWSQKRSVTQLKALLLEQRRAPVAAAALAPVAKQQVQVQAAREVVRSSLSEWQPAVKRAREAEHVSFPARGLTVGGATCGTLAHSLKPHTSLEKEIDDVLQDQGDVFRDPGQAGAVSEDGLPPNPVAASDLAAQQARVAKIRSLLFFQERQAKRNAKIKSKGYRKMRRREREKAMDAEAEAATLDQDMASTRARKYELRRARERISLKGQKKSNRFHHVQHDEDAKDVVERTARAVAHRPSDDSSGSDSEEMVDAMEAEAALEQGGSKPGVFGMKFMKNYMERKRAEAEGAGDEGADGGDGTEKGEFDSSSLIRGPVLRSYKLRSAGPVSVEEAGALGGVIGVGDDARSEASLRISGVGDGRGVGGGEDQATEDSKGDGRGSDDDASPSAALSPWLAQRSKAGGAVRQSVKAQTRIVVNPADSIDNLREDAPKESAQRVQDDLVARAFVGDVDREEDFAVEKSAEVEDGAEKPIPDLPGWGAWSGERIPAKKSKQFLQQAAVAERRNRERSAARKDAGKSHVIINERRNKRIAHYMADGAPHPYTTPVTYESLLRHPIGPEWNPIKSHLEMIAPKVSVQRGSLIDPAVKPTTGRKKPLRRKQL